MSRKRVAIFANGWGNDCLMEIGHGVRQEAALADMDVFAFVDYSVNTEIDEVKKKEFNIFTLPDLRDFDAAIALGNSLNSHFETEYIQEMFTKTRIPTMCLEYKMDGVDYLGSDDYSGMHELARHMMVDHKVKDILYMGGIKGHSGEEVRKKAVLDVAKECGVTIPEENILIGDFSGARAVEELQKWCLSHPKMPEAIICANDNMAIGLCDWLKEHGFRIPEDIKITGFDCIKDGQEYQPVITSVNREWVKMGSKCMEKLLRKMEGKEVSSGEEMETSMVCGGSCGCRFDPAKAEQRKIRRRSSGRQIDGFYCDQHFRRMYISVRHSDTAEGLKYSLTRFLGESNWLEGNRVVVALHPDFFHMTELGTEKMKEVGYPEEMEVVCSLYDGKDLGKSKIPTKEAIFLPSEGSETPGAYVYVPIRNDEMNFGFAMLSRGFSIVQNNILYIWTRHMNQYMEQVRSNITIRMLTKRLEMLSVTDKLTEVYNRTGCESIMYEKMESCQLDGGQSIVMIADLDGLKTINDTFGHASGDKAIKLAVDTLKKVLPSYFMIGRFGGDEFLLCGTAYEKIDMEALIQSILNGLRDRTAQEQLPFALSLSVGGIQLAKGEEFRVEKCIQRADALMYHMKTAHHDEMKN